MSKKLYVGNIDWNITDEELKTKFSEFGEVEEAIIIKDKMTGKPKGFGFVTFSKDEDADAAKQALDGQDFNGRPLTVNEARPQKERTF